MSLEAAIQALTDAVKENTAQHAAFAEIARKSAPAGTKAAPKAAPKAEGPADEEAAPKKAAPKKAAPKKAVPKAEKPELPTEVDVAELRGLARSFTTEGADRDKNKQNFAAALKHLGAENLSGVSDEDRPKLHGYITYWKAGLPVDFEEIDALVTGDSEDGEGDAEAEAEDDDMLG